MGECERVRVLECESARVCECESAEGEWASEKECESVRAQNVSE